MREILVMLQQGVNSYAHVLSVIIVTGKHNIHGFKICSHFIYLV